MGNLYIVSTPIGNLQDLSIRAAHVLTETPVIITESTSKFGILAEFIEKMFSFSRVEDQKVISYSEDEEDQKLPSLIKLLEQNDVALVSEAGTPLISDPGFKFVREAIKRGISVVSIPGASAPIAALTSSGLPTDKFFFAGYLPKKDGKKTELLKNLKLVKQNIGTTLIFFESPHRLVDSLKSIQSEFGDADIVVERELTKVHEEIRREKVSAQIEHFSQNAPKGEFVLLI